MEENFERVPGAAGEAIPDERARAVGERTIELGREGEGRSPEGRADEIVLAEQEKKAADEAMQEKAQKVKELTEQLEAAKKELGEQAGKVRDAEKKVREAEKKVFAQKKKELDTLLEARNLSLEDYEKSLASSIEGAEAEKKALEERVKYNPELARELEELEGDLSETKRKKQLVETVKAGLEKGFADEEEPAEEPTGEGSAEEPAGEETGEGTPTGAGEGEGEFKPVMPIEIEEETAEGESGDGAGEELDESAKAGWEWVVSKYGVGKGGEGVAAVAESLSEEEKAKLAAAAAEKLRAKKPNVWKRFKTAAIVAVLAIVLLLNSGCSSGVVNGGEAVNLDNGISTEAVVNLDDGEGPEAEDGLDVEAKDFGDMIYEYVEEADPTKGEGNQYWVLKDGGLKGSNATELIDDMQDKIEKSWDYATLFGSALDVDGLGGTKVEDILDKSAEYERTGNNKFRYDVSEYIESAGWNMNDIRLFSPTSGSFFSEYYRNGNNVTGESHFAASERDIAASIASRGEGSEGEYIDLSNVLTDEQKENVCQMLGLDMQDVLNRGGIFAVREGCGQIGVYFGPAESVPVNTSETVSNPTSNPETPPQGSPETPSEQDEEPPAEEVVEEPEDEPEEEPEDESEDEPEESEEKIEEKSPENEQRIVDDFEDSGEAEGRVEQTPSDQIGDQTAEPGTPDWEQPGGTGEVPTDTGSYTPEEAAAAEVAQAEADASEDTTPVEDDEFEAFMERFNNGQ